MRIVLLGSSDFSIPTLNALHHSKYKLVSIISPSDKPKGRGKKIQISNFRKRAIELSYASLQIDNFNNEETIRQLTSFDADIFVVVAFQKLPDRIIDIPQYGCLNIHPSKLPKYRGSSPIQYALMNGEKDIGISIIKLSSKIDSGNILYQSTLNVAQYENFGDIYNKTSIIGSENLIKTINIIEKTSNYNGTPQDNTKATYAKKLFSKDFILDWTKSSLEIQNKIRSLAPYPGAVSFLNKKRFKIFDSEIISKTDFEIKNKLYPGSICIYQNNLYVKTKDSFISISTLQKEGKRKMNIDTFLKGNKINSLQFDN